MRRSTLAALLPLLGACAAVTGLGHYELDPNVAEGGSEAGARSGGDTGAGSSVPAACACPLVAPDGFTFVAFAGDRARR